MPSTDWLRPTHILEGYVLYSKSASLNVNLKTTFTIAHRLMFDLISVFEHHELTKWTSKIN